MSSTSVPARRPRPFRRGLGVALLGLVALAGSLLGAGTAHAGPNLSCDGTNLRLVQTNQSGSEVLQNEINTLDTGHTMAVSLNRAPQFAFVTHTGTVKRDTDASFTYIHPDGYPVFAHTSHASGNGVIRHEGEIEAVSSIGFAGETLLVRVLFETNNCGKVGGDMGYLAIRP